MSLCHKPAHKYWSYKVINLSPPYYQCLPMPTIYAHHLVCSKHHHLTISFWFINIISVSTPNQHYVHDLIPSISKLIQTSYSLNHYFVHDFSSTLDQHHIVSIITLAHKRFSTKSLLQLLQSFLYDMDKHSHTNFSTVCVKQTFTLFTLTCPAVFSFTTMISKCIPKKTC